MCLIRLFVCYRKSITIALIVATSFYFHIVDEKLTHVIDEIDTIVKNIEI